jgi:hypothetical protein
MDDKVDLTDHMNLSDIFAMPLYSGHINIVICYPELKAKPFLGNFINARKGGTTAI